jgi:hypothetical protein
MTFEVTKKMIHWSNCVHNFCTAIIMSRRLSVEEVMEMLERRDSEDDDPMEVVTAGSGDEMDADYLMEGDEIIGCK